MKNRKTFATFIVAAALFVFLPAAVIGQTANDGKLANVIGGGSMVRWEVLASNSGGTLTISTPDGRSFRRTFRAGTSPEISLTDKQLEGLPDGAYSYELRLVPVLSAGVKDALMKARGNDDDPEAERAARKRPTVPSMVQSGSFSIQSGSIIVAGAVEGQRSGKVSQPRQPVSLISANTVTRLRNHRFSMGALPDDVIPDDLIVQGSACVGLDCVNGEVFGFDTVRLKENNTRLQFDDTSTSQGFPTNNWQIRANDSGSGGGSFLGIVDQGSTGNSETGTIVARFDAGAPTNSIRVDSVGRVGLRTAVPVLALHINESDTPDMRLEQNNSGGFSAQTWDIGGNEANFFVRDVTSGSRLPFRIRPGAPTSSIDISATGLVGVGIAAPTQKLHVSGSDASIIRTTIENTGAGQSSLEIKRTGTTPSTWVLYAPSASTDLRIFDGSAGGVGDMVTFKNGGSVGIGTSSPDQKFSVNGEASKVGGGSWATFSDERLKNIKGHFNSGLKAVMQLQPLRYEYKPNNQLGLKSEGEHIGFGAQALQRVIPEAVTKNNAGYLMVNNDPILWTMLNAIKEQQQEIAELRAQIRKLQTPARRRAR